MQLKSNISKLAVAVSVAVMSAGEVNAGVVTFDFNDSNFLQGTELRQGAFDLSSFIESYDTAGQDVDIASATLRIFGYSNEQNSGIQNIYVNGNSYSSPGYSYSVGYSCGSWWSSRTCYYTVYVPGYYYSQSEHNQLTGDGIEDILLVDFGDQLASLSTKKADTFVNTYYYYNSYQNYYVNERYNVYNRNDFGDVLDSILLNTSNLDLLKNNSFFNFDYKAGAGNFSNLNFFLDVEYDTTARGTVSNSIPSPAPAMLLGTGLIGLALAKRNRRRKQK